MKWLAVFEGNGILADHAKTLWPSGLRRWLKAPVRKGMGSNPTGVILGYVDEGRGKVGKQW